MRGPSSPRTRPAERGAAQHALLQLFVADPQAAIERSVAAVLTLPSIDDCAIDRVRVRASADPEDQAALAAITAEVAAAEQAQAAGMYAAAVTRAEAVLDRADALGDRATQARVRLAIAQARSRQNDPDAAHMVLIIAIKQALASDDVPLAVQIASLLVYVDGYQRHDITAGETWATTVDGLLDRIDRPVILDGTYHHNLALALREDQRLDESLAQSAAALALLGDAPDNDLHRSYWLAAEGSTLRRMGRYDQAFARLQSAADLQRDLLGVQHPSYGNTLNLLGSVALDAGRLDEAEQTLRTALTIIERSRGAVSREAIQIRTNIALVLARRGVPAQAVAELAQAWQLASALQPRDDRLIATVGDNYVLALRMARDFARGREVQAEVRAAIRRADGEDSIAYANALASESVLYSETPEHALALADRAIALLAGKVERTSLDMTRARTIRALALAELDRCAEAVDEFADIVALTQQQSGRDPAALVGALVNQIDCLLALGRNREAVAAAERAVDLDRPANGRARGFVELRLAQALVATGELARARAILDAADTDGDAKSRDGFAALARDLARRRSAAAPR